MPRLSPRTIQLLLLALITMAHVATRLESQRQYPLGKRLFFPESFRYSLAVMAGLGLNPVPFSGDPTSIPLQDFLAVQSEGISAQEFEAWKQSRQSAETVHDSPLTYEDQHLTWPLYTTRVLDLLVAAADVPPRSELERDPAAVANLRLLARFLRSGVEVALERPPILLWVEPAVVRVRSR